MLSKNPLQLSKDLVNVKRAFILEDKDQIIISDGYGWIPGIM